MEDNKPMPNTPKLTQVQSNNSTANHMRYLPSQFDSPHQGNLMGSCDGSCAALQRRQDRPILYENSSFDIGIADLPLSLENSDFLDRIFS
jgi:hypothetical protein